jgi:nucleotide-binding universal stress UspA family protein
MNKHFLVTVSDDYEHLTGVEFICSFFKKLSVHQITLLHICRLDANDMNKALMEMWEDPEVKVEGRLTVGARKALQKATALLSQSKMSVDQMITKTCAERFGKIKDILNEGNQGLYDALILGKRASYALQWMFERAADETAQAIIKDKALTTPLWICPAPEAGRKNVLVCVDGSDESLRAVDHTGYILARQDQHAITLLHVENGAGLDSEQIFARSVQALANHGIYDERISRETIWGLNIAGTVKSYAEKQGFAAIAVGLHGVEQGFMKRINLAGGTTSSLIESAEKVSIWCCP